MSDGARAGAKIWAVDFSSQGARPLHEDAVVCDLEKQVFAVADGFGGGPAGIQAARLSCDSARAFLAREARDPDATMPFVLKQYYSLAGNVLFNAVLYANQQVQAWNSKRAVGARGGASLTAAFLDGQALAIAQVGGTRAYLLRQGHLEALTEPRSYSSFCDPADREGGRRDAPLMAIGVTADVEPEIREYRVESGDWIVLCTDGIAESRIAEFGARIREATEATHSEALLGAMVEDFWRSQLYADNASGVFIRII